VRTVAFTYDSVVRCTALSYARMDARRRVRAFSATHVWTSTTRLPAFSILSGARWLLVCRALVRSSLVVVLTNHTLVEQFSKTLPHGPTGGVARASGGDMRMHHEFSFPTVVEIRRQTPDSGPAPTVRRLGRPTQRHLVQASLLRCPDVAGSPEDRTSGRAG